MLPTSQRVGQGRSKQRRADGCREDAVSLRFGAGSMRHRDVFDVYYHLRIRGIDVGVLGSCAAKDIFGDESMREEGRADVYARLERVFEDRHCVRRLSGAKDNWLELPVGEVTAGILPEVKKLMTKR